MNRKRIAIVTDSTADLPADVVSQNQIYVVPIAVVVDGKTMEDGDQEGGAGERISRHDFFERMPHFKSFPTTAAPPPSVYQRIFDKALAAGYEYIVSITLSSDLSATYNSAVMAAESFAGRSFVFDSKQVSLGLGFQVLEAAEKLAAVEAEHPNGDLTSHIAAVIDELGRVRLRERVIALVDTLEYLRRGGRVSWTQAALGSLLRVKVLVEVTEGKVVRLGRARTRKHGIAQMIAQINKLGSLKRIGFVHSGANEEEIGEVKTALLPQLDARGEGNVAPQPIVDWLTPVIGAHTGTNTLAVAALAWDL